MEYDNLKILLNSLNELVSDYIKQYCDAEDISFKKAFDFLYNNGNGPYSFKIGKLKIHNPVISAPLAGISDNTYRIFAKAFGCGLTFSEMVTGYGIYYNHKKSNELADITEFERPCALQLFGSDPHVMAEAARMIEQRADIIDINMGCPVPKIIKAKSGGYLVNDEKKLGKIISMAASVLVKPLTIKTRTGWNKDSVNVISIARIAADSGASAITIHGRTVKQGFAGDVDYSIVKEVKKKVSIPVIVSGDIGTPQKALEVLEYTGCDGIMIGRASKGNLWLFLNIVLFLMRYREDRTDVSFNMDFKPDIDWKKRFAVLYLRFLVLFKGETRAVKEFRKHLSWIFKGVEGISKKRKKFYMIENIYDAMDTIGRI
jgi:tRNA-dihydrouridine synthase B